ncbi:hypothetical protein Rxyl_0930 [Rubrobacter xylanophilus DSM 9941]|uniref:Uncharacterized protein n=1 Tax=Rubrobacter xylanophilus (strain DSM 9941 / JCM 11954 / NBRC 16129 / PRD-1) TaxID=266117 RepID=Q1AXI1_RUBXD|nr:hypothetical protein [Rubrobacter xylanophilus]ABG03897.1 hypothetical protein Rxyl_0930 [Rubrobacter xylanophilus DSM 9941]
MNLGEALEEVWEEYGGRAMVISARYERPLGEVLEEAGEDGREVWVEWGEVSSGGVSVPATHILFLDEDGYMRRDGSGLAVVSLEDYRRLRPFSREASRDQ